MASQNHKRCKASLPLDLALTILELGQELVEEINDEENMLEDCIVVAV